MTACALLVLSVLFQTLFIALDVFPSDEGLVLVASEDVSQGQLLYKDCHIPVTPLAYFIQGLAFKAFGSSIQISRLLICLTYASIVALVFMISITCMSYRYALLAGLIAVLLQVWVWPHAQFFSYTPLSVLFCTLSIYLAWLIEVRPERLRRAFVLGAALGAAVWAKPNLGILAAFGVLLYWLTCIIRSAGGSCVYRRRGIVEMLREGLATLGGMAIITVPLVLYLIHTGTFKGMVESLRALLAIYGDVPGSLFPDALPITTQLDGMRVNPLLVVPGMLFSKLMVDQGIRYLFDYTLWIDSIVRVVYYSLPCLITASGVYVGYQLVQKKWSKQNESTLLILIVACSLFLSILPHAAIHYLMPVQIPSVVLFCFLFSRVPRSFGVTIRRLGIILAVCSLGVYVALSTIMLRFYISLPREPVQTKAGTFWLHQSEARGTEDLLRYLNNNTSNQDTVYVYPYYPIIYFMSGLRHASRFIDLRPGSPGEAAEDEIIEALEVDRVRLVLYFVGAQYPGLERVRASYPRLHHYLATHFEVEREFERYGELFAQIKRRRPRKEN
jgi:hypothetical protein